MKRLFLLAALLLTSGKVHADYVTASGVISTTNSTTVALAARTTFYGGAEQNGFDHVMVNCKTDAVGTLYKEFSSDGTNWDSILPPTGFTVSTGTNEFHTSVKGPRYFRVRFVNGNTDQNYLRLQTSYSNNLVPSVSPLNLPLSLDGDALSVRPSDFEDEVAIARRSGVSFFGQFGYRNNLTAANGDETIWPSTGSFIPMTSAAPFVIQYSNLTDGSNDSATGAKRIAIFYVDANGNPATAIHILGSNGTDTTTFSGFGINRVAVSLSSGSRTNVNNISISTVANGPIQAFIPAGDSVSQECIFMNGSNHKTVIKGISISAYRTTGGQSPRIQVYGYIYSRVSNSIYKVYSELIDTAATNSVSTNRSFRLVLNETDVIYFTADTNTDGAAITLDFNLDQYQNN